MDSPPPLTGLGNTNVTSSPSLLIAFVRPKQAVPNPPLMKGGNSQPSMNIFTTPQVSKKLKVFTKI
jgi:hypothetical protein